MSWVQAVTLSMTSFQAMARIAKHYRGRFTTIVGFRPTGWSLGAAQKGAVAKITTSRGTVAIAATSRSHGPTDISHMTLLPHKTCCLLLEYCFFTSPGR